MASRSFLLLGVLASLLAISQPAAAWGRRGHAAIAEIAETHLTPTARAQVKALLINDLDKYERPSGRHRLADIASWADEIRDVAPPDTYRGWHSRSNSVCSETLGPCPGGRCVDEKLRHYIAVLKNLHASHRERNEALKFVVHLVGDLHVPLHSGSNRDKTGHFPATLEGRPARENSTLHSLWDHELASAATKDRYIKAKFIATNKLPDDAIAQWMRETRDLSRKYVYEPLPGFTCNRPFRSNVVLSRTYQKQAKRIILKQVRRAGVRLAHLLNETLK